VFSAPIVLLVVVVLVFGCGSKRFARMERDEWRRQPERASLLPPRRTAEDDDDDEDDSDRALHIPGICQLQMRRSRRTLNAGL
jgi:hypothetical protein